jgi:hypothetical protein
MNIDYETIERLLEKRGAYPEFYMEYGEPGCENPPRGIIMADWNHVHRRVYDWLEHRGFALEWSDEWISDDNGKIYRSSPDSYGWLPSYWIRDDGSVFGKDEVSEDPEGTEYLEHLLDNPKSGDTFGIDWTRYGFERIEEEHDSGIRETSEDPRKIFRDLRADYPGSEFLFSIDSMDQFEAHWYAWKRGPQHDAHVTTWEESDA